MKIIGLMCVKNEADLLPETFPHVKNLVDDLVVYVGTSVDDTYDLVKNCSYVISENDDNNYDYHMARYPYHHLLQNIKKNYDYNLDDVWVVIAMGDRFFLNKTPRKIAEDAEEEGFISVEGVKTDFLRCRADPWTETNDTFPNYPDSLRNMCRWVKSYERQVFAFKVTDLVSYGRSPYPWPKGLNRSPQYSKDFGREMSPNMPFHEHQGRRSPRAWMWRHQNGCVGKSRKHNHDYSSYQSIVKTFKGFYRTDQCLPWLGLETINQIVEFFNSTEYLIKKERRAYYTKIENIFINEMGKKLPPRTDI